MKQLCFIFLMTILSVFSAQAIDMPTITITFNGNSAEVNVPKEITQVDYAVNGADVIINNTTTALEYLFVVSGQSDNGSLTINGNYKFTLQLNGVSLHCEERPAIDIECGKRIAVIISDGTVNTLSDGPDGVHKAAFYIAGHAEFEGGGTLNVTGNTKHAICAKEYMLLTRSVGTINILGAVSDGIHCGKGKVNNEHNYFDMRGGIININNVGSDGIDSDDFGTVRINGGIINASITGDDSDGIKADSTLNISGGNINLTVSGNKSNAIKANYYATISGGKINAVLTGDGTKAIKANNANSTVLNGGMLYISGGEIEVYSLGNHIYEETDSTKSMGISADRDLNFTGGEVLIYAMGPEAKGYNVKGTERIRGGSLQVIKAPWKLNPYSFQQDMSSYVAVKMDDEMVSDYTNLAVGAFNGDECVGIALFRNADFGEMRIRSHSTDADSITFRLYDYEKEVEVVLNADRDVTFIPNECYGYPSAPVILGGQYPEERIKGDVNLDGKVDINDVVAIINVMAGSETFFDTADVNEDGKRNINDVVSVINIMAGQ